MFLANAQMTTSRALIWGSLLAFLVFIGWADWAELDQITRATGQVIASSRNQVIQSMEGGVLAELPVREGAVVKRGQLLVRFDQTKAEASYLESKAKSAGLRATVARLNAEVFGGELRFPDELRAYPEFAANQMSLYKKRQGALQEELSALQKAEELIRDELQLNLPLVKTGDVSRTEVIRLQRQLVDIQGQIANRRNKYMQDSQAELVKAEEELAGVQQILAQRKEQLVWTEIFSPMDGVVRNVRLTTLGGVARPGEEIMQVVPVDDQLIFEVKVRPTDIAFIKPGLPAVVKLDAYDYTLYGTLQGEVTYISADTLIEDARGPGGLEQTYYRVQVKTAARELKAQANGGALVIQPGMTATVEIKTGKKSVLRYLTKPITKTLSESLGER